MLTNSRLLSRIRRAAELRVAGQSWETISKMLNRKRDTCRKWSLQYPDLWAQSLREAEQNAIYEAGAEGLLRLRQLLRSDSEKTIGDAAEQLVKIHLDLLKSTMKANPASPKNPQWESLFEYLSSLSHVEKKALLDQLPRSEEGSSSGVETDAQDRSSPSESE